MRLVAAIWEDYYPFHLIDGVNNNFFCATDPSDLQTGDILITHGGEDIAPVLYNKGRSSWSGTSKNSDEVMSKRDAIEWNLMKRAVELGVPIVGICRGAQMLCALAGGYLIQHVNGHSGQHTITTYDNKQLTVNSIHHQMMYPFDCPHELIAWSSEKLSDVYFDVDDDVDVPVEPEFVYFPTVKGFAIQWHPEMMNENAPATQYVLNFINAKLKEHAHA